MNRPMLAAACLLLAMPPAATRGDAPMTQPAGENLLANGQFSRDSDGDGIADGWSFSGDPKGLTVRMALDAGRGDGSKSQRMECTEFRGGSGWSHAMLCQLDHVRIRKGYSYTLVFWARARGIRAGGCNVGLQDTRGWKPLGLYGSFMPAERWERFEFHFTGENDCDRGSRLQIWFTSTGTLWVADASLVESAPMFGVGPRRPTHPIEAVAGSANLVPNGSFEMGPAGWGSRSYRSLTWGNQMNALFGEVVEAADAPHGGRCLRIALTPKTFPVACFDYFNAVREVIDAPLAGNLGWIATEPGKDYTLSAYLKADAEGRPARIGVQFFDQWTPTTVVKVGTKWQRFTYRFQAKTAGCYVLVGPDMDGSVQQDATLWIDAVQLEKGRAASDFGPRQATAAMMRLARPGGIYFVGEQSRVILASQNFNPGGVSGTMPVTLTVTDYFGRQVFQRRAIDVSAKAGGSGEMAIDLPLPNCGFYRVSADGPDGPLGPPQRVAVIRKYEEADSFVGINHAYAWPNLVRASIDGGIVWARDWTLKWQLVEPARGKFDFAMGDVQVQRVLDAGGRALALLPFPSANWSSSAPDSVKATNGYPGVRERMWYAPRDVQEFKDYVGRTVAHYRGKVQWYQVFNEPLYTDYSLPRKCGYTAEDYVKYVKAFSEAARTADPDCRILAGPGGWLGGSGEDLRRMLAADMMKHCDALDLHTYPGLRTPESLEREIAAIHAMAVRAGDKPIWLTEHGYYADDDWQALPPRDGFPEPLPDEQTQADYSVRLDLILLAHGVRKIFYHAGTSPGLNLDQLESIFFRYDGQPRKVYPAVATLAGLLGPEPRFIRDLGGEGRERTFLFRAGKRLVLAAWDPRGGGATLSAGDAKVKLVDVVGAPVGGGRAVLGASPVYASSDELSEADFVSAVKLTPAP
ncbi:MAG: hypothetical protein BIFFINMI_02584 [Phycisphaerae bacterium]|nr:hypothetical protein [Phycisphaerae bacterium]